MNRLRNTLLCILILAFQSCEKNDDEFGVEDKAYFETEINGEKITLIESETFTESDTDILKNSSCQISYEKNDSIIDLWVLNLGKSFDWDKPERTKLSVKFVNHFESDKITEEQFREVFWAGEKEYTQNSKEFEGVMIRWFDANGELWCSGEPYTHDDLVQNENSENYFAINYSEFLDESSNKNDFNQYLDISFQCRLYNWKGESILMENARLKYIYHLFQRI